MSVLQGRVKSVQSGDTLILVNARGLEKTLSLAYISAPRPKREGDEVRTFLTFPLQAADVFLAVCLPIS